MRQRSPGGVDASSAPGSAQIIQVGISEKALLFVVLAVLVVSLAVSIIAFAFSIRAESSAIAAVASLRETVRTNNAKYEVLQYDHTTLKQQLVAKGLYQPTEH